MKGTGAVGVSDGYGKFACDCDPVNVKHCAGAREEGGVTIGRGIGKEDRSRSVIAVGVELGWDGEFTDVPVTILVAFDVREGCLDGALVKKVQASVSHVKIIGGGDGRIKVVVCLPFVHSCDESLIVAMEVNGRKRCCLRYNFVDGDVKKRAGREGKEHASCFRTEGVYFGE